MTARILILCFALSCAAQAQKAAHYHSGKLLQVESVQCVVAGTEDPSAPASTVDCNEYVLDAGGVLFHFHALDPRHPETFPVGKAAQYRIQEGHFFVRVDGQEREVQVVSMESRGNRAAPVKSVKLNHAQ